MRTILSSASQNLEGKNSMSSKAASRALPEERASTVERIQEYSVGVVQEKIVTSTLNASTNVLAALMRKRPLNNMASVTATNRRWGKAADGTRTQVVICLTNRWKVRIWEGLYNVRIPLWRRGESNNRSQAGRAKEKVFLDKFSLPLCNHLKHNDQRLFTHQGLAF